MASIGSQLMRQQPEICCLPNSGMQNVSPRWMNHAIEEYEESERIEGVNYSGFRLNVPSGHTPVLCKTMIGDSLRNNGKGKGYTLVFEEKKSITAALRIWNPTEGVQDVIFGGDIPTHWVCYNSYRTDRYKMDRNWARLRYQEQTLIQIGPDKWDGIYYETPMFVSRSAFEAMDRYLLLATRSAFPMDDATPVPWATRAPFNDNNMPPSAWTVVSWTCINNYIEALRDISGIPYLW
ncbi:hypothetical protein F5Y18DRAFT_170665 [Xylariaceae sp. FL1019]|nr:hypothetical protein F5Y18DRAFT_170665 [Xylariaceae sp. FL1019]